MIFTDKNYPESLPLPLIDERSVNHVNTIARTDMVSGRARQRVGFSSVPSMQSVAFYMSRTDTAAFEGWYRDVITNGVDWFNMRLRTPIGLTSHVCRFTRIYNGPNPVSQNIWGISAELELYERPLVPEGWGEFPDYIRQAAILDVAVNVYLPSCE